jgi:hypothetical protein
MDEIEEIKNLLESISDMYLESLTWANLVGKLVNQGNGYFSIDCDNLGSVDKHYLPITDEGKITSVNRLDFLQKVFVTISRLEDQYSIVSISGFKPFGLETGIYHTNDHASLNFRKRCRISLVSLDGKTVYDNLDTAVVGKEDI